MSVQGRRCRGPNFPADPSTAGTDDVLDVAPIAAVTSNMKSIGNPLQQPPPEVRHADKCKLLCTCRCSIVI